jgi:tRNA 2-selenouridine synthase
MERSSITIDAVLQAGAPFDAIIDVRSPAEFAQDHMPGALNLPVLDDDERARVGTLHRDSTFEARRIGAALVARNIARHLDTALADKSRSWRPLVYCWRGGQRSGALVHVLERVGWHARQLEGGYRSYRRAVVADLERLPAGLRWRVVCGTTGSGKSRLLQHLAGAGAQVLDLEGLAHHRGSVLGAMPTRPQPSQKMFESRLWDALRGFDAARPVFVESESRKVGDLRVPDQLIAAMREASCLRLELPLPARVRLLRNEYEHFEAQPELLERQLDCLAALHGKERVGAWKELARQRDWDRMVERLLVEHYDPAYQRSIRRNFAQLDSAQVLQVADEGESAFSELARRLAA